MEDRHDDLVSLLCFLGSILICAIILGPFIYIEVVASKWEPSQIVTQGVETATVVDATCQGGGDCSKPFPVSARFGATPRQYYLTVQTEKHGRVVMLVPYDLFCAPNGLDFNTWKNAKPGQQVQLAFTEYKSARTQYRLVR